MIPWRPNLLFTVWSQSLMITQAVSYQRQKRLEIVFHREGILSRWCLFMDPSRWQLCIAAVSLIKVVCRKFSISKSQKQLDRLMGECDWYTSDRNTRSRRSSWLHVPNFFAKDFLDKISPSVGCTSEDETNRFFSTIPECSKKISVLRTGMSRNLARKLTQGRPRPSACFSKESRCK